jgi:hypothetical protein
MKINICSTKLTKYIFYTILFFVLIYWLSVFYGFLIKINKKKDDKVVQQMTLDVLEKT